MNFSSEKYYRYLYRKHSNFFFELQLYDGTFNFEYHAYKISKQNNTIHKELKIPSSFLDFHPLEEFRHHIRLKYWIF